MPFEDDETVKKLNGEISEGAANVILVVLAISIVGFVVFTAIQVMSKFG
jgi:hypothetical protein